MTPSQETQDETPPVARGGSRTRLVVVLVLLIVAAAAAYAAYLHFRDRVSSDDANVDGHISAIAPKISGNVVEVAVEDNQTVKAGQVLVRIDPRDYQAAVDVAKAAVLQAEDQLHTAQVTVPWVSSSPFAKATAYRGVRRLGGGRRTMYRRPISHAAEYPPVSDAPGDADGKLKTAWLNAPRE